MQAKMGQAKIVTCIVSKTKSLKNKFTGHHGHQEFQNEVIEEPSRISKPIKTGSSKLASVKNLFKPSYKPLSV